MALPEEVVDAEAAERAILAGGASPMPGQGRENRLRMDEGAAVRYGWTVQGGVVNHDIHGDPVDAPAM